MRQCEAYFVEFPLARFSLTGLFDSLHQQFCDLAWISSHWLPKFSCFHFFPHILQELANFDLSLVFISWDFVSEIFASGFLRSSLRNWHRHACLVRGKNGWARAERSPSDCSRACTLAKEFRNTKLYPLTCNHSCNDYIVVTNAWIIKIC